MHHPVLYLGLLGFDAQGELAMRDALAAHALESNEDASSEAEHPIWEIVNFQEADALLICGAGVVQASDAHLWFDDAIRHNDPAAPLAVDLKNLTAPYALSDMPHLQALGIQVEPPIAFSVSDVAPLRNVLRRLEALLRPMRALYALAAEITARKHELDALHTFHLEHHGNLDAIIDPVSRRAFLRPDTRPVDIHSDAWLSRPKSANFAPSHFIECSLEELAWVYAMHVPHAQLPKRYQTKPIHIRRSIKVRASLLSARHTALLDCLWEGAATLDVLRHALPDHTRWIERDLMGMYLTRCISTTAPQETNEGHSSLPGGAGSMEKWTLRHTSQRPTDTITGALNPLF
jgi:hypothetical protein